MTRYLLVALMVTALLYDILSVAAAAPADELLERLDTFTRLQGRFEQRQADADGRELGTSSGNFKLLRPDWFLWEITAPDSQLIIADPDYLWHYDRDLDTVTRRPVGSTAGAAPLQVLGGEGNVLREQYAVEQRGPDRFVLTPRSDDAGFLELTVTFEDGELRRMDIVDRLNQRVEVTLSGLDRESPLTPADFAFTPPPDADLFYYDD